jgi:hypothetical protein
MIRLIWISDTEIKGIFYWFLKRISYTKEYYRIKGEVAEEIMEMSILILCTWIYRDPQTQI